MLKNFADFPSELNPHNPLLTIIQKIRPTTAPTQSAFEQPNLTHWYILGPRRFSSDAMKSPRCLATAYQWTEMTHLLHLCTFNTFLKHCVVSVTSY